MLEKPDLIGRVGAALIRKALHGAPGRLVVDEPRSRTMRGADRAARRRGASTLPAAVLKRPSSRMRASVVQAGVVAVQRLLRPIAGAHQRARTRTPESPRQSPLAIAIEFRRASRSARQAGDWPWAAGTVPESRYPLPRPADHPASPRSPRRVSPSPSIRLLFVNTAGLWCLACASTRSVCS